ncbi:6005_t:CDS:2 [Ambispora gerdemannii]|uniref:6005_t:CDS:1 n=1 Tax=Ambispora gerdemannii TaxID=144530 RepID=A0A9N9A009_9GLOM|nr:6005_t:CDS:2 [Ambispora gerdemannii]
MAMKPKKIATTNPKKLEKTTLYVNSEEQKNKNTQFSTVDQLNLAEKSNDALNHQKHKTEVETLFSNYTEFCRHYINVRPTEAEETEIEIGEFLQFFRSLKRGQLEHYKRDLNLLVTRQLRKC